MSEKVEVLVMEREWPAGKVGKRNVSGRTRKQLAALYAKTVNHNGRGACMSHQLAADMMMVSRDAAKDAQSSLEADGIIFPIDAYRAEQHKSGGGDITIWGMDLEKIEGFPVITNAWQVTVDAKRTKGTQGSETPPLPKQNAGVSDPPVRKPRRGLRPPRSANAGVSDPPLGDKSPSLRSGDLSKGRTKSLLDTGTQVDPRFAGFTELWRLWRAADTPDKIARDRKAARGEYETLIKAGIDAARIMAGARIHCSNPAVTGKNADYLGKLSTFLASEAWDELADKGMAERDGWLENVFVHGCEWNTDKLGPKPSKAELTRMHQEWSERNQERAA